MGIGLQLRTIHFTLALPSWPCAWVVGLHVHCGCYTEAHTTRCTKWVHWSRCDISKVSAIFLDCTSAVNNGTFPYYIQSRTWIKFRRFCKQNYDPWDAKMRTEKKVFRNIKLTRHEKSIGHTEKRNRWGNGRIFQQSGITRGDIWSNTVNTI